MRTICTLVVGKCKGKEMIKLNKDYAFIELKTADVLLCFIWEQYDGDDCFGIHKIQVKQNNIGEEFFLGRAIVRTLKGMNSFHSKIDPEKPLRFFGQYANYSFSKIGLSFELNIFRDQEILFQVTLHNPVVRKDCEFLYEYYGDDF